MYEVEQTEEKLKTYCTAKV